MRDQGREAQTAEEMQAAVRRLIAKQSERQQGKRGRPPQGRDQAPWPPDPAKMPQWWTPEKQAYSDQVMRDRGAAEQAETQRRLEQEEQHRRLRIQHHQQEENKRQEKRKLDAALTSAAVAPVKEDELNLASQHGLSGEMVRSLFAAMNQRPLTPEETVWFMENLVRTEAKLPYIPDHFANTQENVLKRLPEEGQWEVSLQQLIQGTASHQLIAKLLNSQLGAYFHQLKGRLEGLPGRVNDLPWQVQYRLAVDWLVSKPEILPTVAWHPLIEALITSVQSKNPSIMRVFLDDLFHTIAENAYLSTEEMDWTPLVAPCRVRNLPKLETVCVHCQGQPWKADAVWCSELRRGCSLPPSGSVWVYANPSLPPYEWSLLELLNYVGITPMQMYAGEGLRSDGDFQKLLGGWLNRLNKIRHLLPCRTCGTLMKPDKGYAKFLAVYPVTIFKCTHHPLPEVKITHCWLCDEVIDSRDSRFQDAGTTYNLCIRCGAGERRRATIGRSCPKCGNGPMRLKKGKNYSSSKVLVCHSCSKSIRVNKKMEEYLSPEVV